MQKKETKEKIRELDFELREDGIIFILGGKKVRMSKQNFLTLVDSPWIRDQFRKIKNQEVFTYSDEIEVDITPVSFAVEQNYPNPFNPVTTIKYRLPNKSNVTINIYNTVGELVEVVVNEIQESGIYQYEWNANRFSSGVYFYVVNAKEVQGGLNYKEVKKMLLLK